MIKGLFHTGKSKDAVNLTILLAVALCIGVYLLVSSVLMAKDGYTFINYAQQLEIDSAHTISKESQHPGYPYLILTAHKIVGLFSENTSNVSWVYCGQSVSLLFRLLSVIVLYYIGKHVVGGQYSFWSVLILLCLPNLAEYGSDVLSDWPYLFFLLFGLLMLIKGIERWWLFGVVGLIAGCGYLIRPECAQLIVIGGAWLGAQFVLSKRSMSRTKLLYALAMLCMGFGLVAGSYMNAKGSIFSKKDVGLFSMATELTGSEPVLIANISAESFPLQQIAKAIAKLVDNLGETFMWFFILPLLPGMIYVFRQRKWIEPKNFFIFALIVFNITVMIWLHCRHGYMSQRHTMPLFVLLSLYVSCGLEILGRWIKLIIPSRRSAVRDGDDRFWFILLFAVGIAICVPKLIRPIRSDKQGFRAAAEWIKTNTAETEEIAVQDMRISFYADRPGLLYIHDNLPADNRYIVGTSKKSRSKQNAVKYPGKIVFEYNAEAKRDIYVKVYQTKSQ